MTQTIPTRAPDRAAGGDRRGGRAERMEQRFAVPAITAAAVSVPAVFLSMMEGGWAVVGAALNWTSLAVLTAESALLLLLARDRLRWIWRHRWTVAITLAAIPAVIFAVAPVQALRLLRLVRLVGTLRILRANRIVKAGRVVARRAGLAGPWRYLPILTGSVLAAGFVAVVLSDPSSESRRFLARVTGLTGIVPVMVAGTILAAATIVMLRYRQRAGGAGEPEEPA